MAENWELVCLLHNLPIKERIGNGYLSLMPHDDVALTRYTDNENFRRYIAAFQDQFGRKAYPSVLMAKGRVKRKPEALVSFRNSLAMASIIHSWENYLAHDSQLEPLKYSGYFDFYPYLPTRDFSNLVVHTPSVVGLDETKRFNGQTTPNLGSARPGKDFFDVNLFAALTDLWRKRHLRGGPVNAQTEAVFRSLEMAYLATRLPDANRGSLSDWGAQLALWVSAFEILAWPQKGNADLMTVLELLRPANCVSSKIAQKIYRVRYRKMDYQATLVEKLYSEIYFARNAFMHGNQVTMRMIFPGGKTDRNNLICYTPILYKCALLTALRPWTTPAGNDIIEYSAWRMENWGLADALLSARKPSLWRRHDIGGRAKKTPKARAT